MNVGFKPSKAFLGDDAYVQIESFAEWLQHTVFSLEKEINISFIATDEDGNEIFNKTYQNTEGNISGFIPTVVGEDLGYIFKKPILLKNRMDITETNIPEKVENPDGTVSINMVDRERFISIEFAFNYAPKIVEPLVYSFTNMIEQIDGGVHVNAFKSSLSSILYEKTKATMKKNNSLAVTADDALTGLVGVVNLNTTMSTGFESQTKHRLGNKKFIAPLKKLYTSALTEYFETTEGKKELKKLIELVKLNASIRLDAVNKRKKVKTNLPSLMDSKLIGNYTAANNIGVPKENLKVLLELYVAEGDSAGGQLRKARYNPDYQGILNFTGKPDNYYNRYRSTRANAIASNNVYAILLDKILGCGYGNHYHEENLIYDKLIFGFDADVDGGHMAGLTLSSIWALAPELIENGHCYRLITPLYKIAASQVAANKMDKTKIDPKDYLFAKSELFERFEDSVLKYTRIKFTTSDDFISNDNMKRFLATNRDYYQVLDTISTFKHVPMEVFEFIAAHEDYQTRIGELDSELHYNDGTISGCYKKEFVALTMSSSVMEAIDYLAKTIRIGNDGIYEYEFYDRRGTNADFIHLGRWTIGRIMEFCQKYSPYITNRYKGLGEMSKYEMHKLAMDPNYRRIARYTVSDAMRFAQTLDELFMLDNKNRKIRKEIVQTSNLSLDDIDN